MILHVKSELKFFIFALIFYQLLFRAYSDLVEKIHNLIALCYEIIDWNFLSRNLKFNISLLLDKFWLKSLI